MSHVTLRWLKPLNDNSHRFIRIPCDTEAVVTLKIF